MPSRRTLVLPLVAVLAALTLLAGACGGSDKADDTKKTTTTEKNGAPSTAPPSTMDDGAFSAGISKAEAAMTDAGKDPCKVMSAFQGMVTTVAAPANAAQRKQAGLLQIKFLRAIADTAPSNLSKEAATLREAADKVQKEGEETNWSEDFMKSPKSLKGSKDYEKASTALVTAMSEKCQPATGGAPQTAPTDGASTVPTTINSPTP